MVYPKGLLGLLKKLEGTNEKSAETGEYPPMKTVPMSHEEAVQVAQKRGEAGPPLRTQLDRTALLSSSFRGSPDYGTKNVRSKKCKFERSDPAVYAKLVFHAGSDVTIRNVKIGALQFEGAHLHLENCDIGDLSLQSDQTSGGIDLGAITNCNIGSLRIQEFSPKSLQIKDSKIFALSSFSSEKIPNGFILSGCEIVTKAASKSETRDIETMAKSSRFKPAPLAMQPFRNLHKWASEHGMSELAHQTRGWELSLEQTLESRGVAKAVLWAWGITSDYGNSPGRSLFLLAGSTFALWAALVCLGTTAAANGPTWIMALCDWQRAALAAFSNIINPYAALSPRALVQPANALGAGLMTLHGILSVALILLTGFSLRRRFKFL